MTTQEKLFKSNENLIYKLAHRFSEKWGTEYEELISVGLVVFAETLERFDVTRGASFTTFLYHRLTGRFLDWYKEELKHIKNASLDQAESFWYKGNDGEEKEGVFNPIEISASPLYEELFLFREMIRTLPEDDRILIKIILGDKITRIHSRYESILPVNEFAARGYMKKEYGWSYGRTSRSWNRIKSFWKSYNLVA